jgi:hypothetical protein
MELSNKALAVLLLSAMIVSLGGTILSLNRMNSVEVVGFATTGTGIVNLTIASFMSITTNDSSLVDFGACSLNDSRAINLTSMSTQDTATYCPSYVGVNISNISVRNNGNVYVNVSIASSECGPGGGNVSCTFLNNSNLQVSENGLFMFNTSNSGRSTYSGGCGTTVAWTTFNGSGTAYRACTNLNNAIPTNSFVTDFLVRLPRGLSTGAKINTITFTASSP